MHISKPLLNYQTDLNNEKLLLKNKKPQKNQRLLAQNKFQKLLPNYHNLQINQKNITQQPKQKIKDYGESKAIDCKQKIGNCQKAK